MHADGSSTGQTVQTPTDRCQARTVGQTDGRTDGRIAALGTTVEVEIKCSLSPS